MDMLCPGARRILMINPHRHDVHLASRIDGFTSFYSQKKKVELVPVLLEDGSPDLPRAVAQALQAANQHGTPFDAVFTANASVSCIASDRALFPSAHPVTIGYDLVPDNIRAMRNGRVDCLISQRPEFQAFEGMMALYRSIILGETPPERINAPLDIYFPENLPD